MRAEAAGDYFARLQLGELLKTMPSGAVWDYYCISQGAPAEPEILGAVHDYDRAVTRKR